MRKKCLAATIIFFSILTASPEATSAVGPIGRYQEFGDAQGFRNILPPGQNDVHGAQTHTLDQLPMYADLVYNAPGLVESRIAEFYKDASFGTPENDIDRVYSPTAGVTVVRDRSFGVPHIFGTTRYATMFAQGYTAAEDRLFLMDVLRHYGRARLSEFLGATPANQSADLDQLADAPYEEADLTAQIAALAASGAEGQAIVDDGQAYTDGVNSYIAEALVDPAKKPIEYLLLNLTLAPWKPEDEIAIATKIAGVFGKGGGGEVQNFCGLKSLTATLGDAVTARAVFDDLHLANDSEAPTTSAAAAPYMTGLGPVDPAAHPDIDCASLASIINNPPGAAASAESSPFYIGPQSMSNALLVAGSHTATGQPIAVFGPQTGYYMPQLLIEKDVHGPGIDARGVAFAGVDTYVQLGRGTDYAWSATSSGADNVDQWVLKLCDPLGGVATTSSMGYLHSGTCVAVTTYQHVQNTSPPISWRVERTADYGPISQRGSLTDGTPIAIANRLSTYGSELASAHGFYRVNNPAYMTNGFTDFQSNMGQGIDLTFNWFYVDRADIGYQHSCKCPQRAQGVDPYMPAWGTGQWDWQGYLPLASQPSALNPAQGYLTSWNNKQAPQFMANDRNFSDGPVYRVQMLNSRIEAAIAAGPLDRAGLVNAMEDAGTVDLRGQAVLPLLLQVMGPTAPGGADARAQDMRDRLAVWAAAAAHRRDFDRNGAYDDPQAPAIMDAWWSPLVHAMFDASSGAAISSLGIGIHDAPQGHNGSAFGGGMYSHVQKDLRQVLGQAVASPWSQTYCGGGDLAACAAALWTSLGQAAASLTTEFGSPIVTDWKRTVSDDEIRSSSVGSSMAPAFHWINRPTFQQLVQILADTDADGIPDAMDNCPLVANGQAQAGIPGVGNQTNSDSGPGLPNGFFGDGGSWSNGPGIPGDDATLANGDRIGDACDLDSDSDGRLDADELAGAGCGGAITAVSTDNIYGGIASPPPGGTSWDTDGDTVPDGVECALGTNPAIYAAGARAACNASLAFPNNDDDGDGLLNAWETCKWGSSNAATNTDGDALGDCKEVMDTNGNSIVTASDATVVKQAVFAVTIGDLAAMDINANGTVNASDATLILQKVFAIGPCL